LKRALTISKWLISNVDRFMTKTNFLFLILAYNKYMWKYFLGSCLLEKWTAKI